MPWISPPTGILRITPLLFLLLLLPFPTSASTFSVSFQVASTSSPIPSASSTEVTVQAIAQQSGMWVCLNNLIEEQKVLGATNPIPVNSTKMTPTMTFIKTPIKTTSTRRRDLSGRLGDALARRLSSSSKRSLRSLPPDETLSIMRSQLGQSVAQQTSSLERADYEQLSRVTPQALPQLVDYCPQIVDHPFLGEYSYFFTSSFPGLSSLGPATSALALGQQLIDLGSKLGLGPQPKGMHVSIDPSVVLQGASSSSLLANSSQFAYEVAYGEVALCSSITARVLGKNGAINASNIQSVIDAVSQVLFNDSSSSSTPTPSPTPSPTPAHGVLRPIAKPGPTPAPTPWWDSVKPVGVHGSMGGVGMGRLRRKYAMKKRR